VHFCTLATENVGVLVVVVVGIGFAAYGAFCLATFTHRRSAGAVTDRDRLAATARVDPGMPKQRLRYMPIRKHELAALGVLYVMMTALWLGVGLPTNPLKDSAIVRKDQSISEWFVRQTDAGLNSLTFIGSMLADTMVKIIVTAVVATVMLILWKRWQEPLMVVIPLILEAMCFITITTLVGRPRPDVPHLDSLGGGFGASLGPHRAAVVYSATVVVIFWHTRNR
jgi:undecaprenyl-diphosphatase